MSAWWGLKESSRIPTEGRKREQERRVFAGLGERPFICRVSNN